MLESVEEGKVYLSPNGFRFKVEKLAKHGQDCSWFMVVYTNLEDTQDTKASTTWVIAESIFLKTFSECPSEDTVQPTSRPVVGEVVTIPTPDQLGDKPILLTEVQREYILARYLRVYGEVEYNKCLGAISQMARGCRSHVEFSERRDAFLYSLWSAVTT